MIARGCAGRTTTGTRRLRRRAAYYRAVADARMNTRTVISHTSATLARDRLSLLSDTRSLGRRLARSRTKLFVVVVAVVDSVADAITGLHYSQKNKWKTARAK
uniref:Uncharacterized protein n=1 Tax=Plectus sambesii TaxID=2011161 RepID=A0A914VUM0_9BILA